MITDQTARSNDTPETADPNGASTTSGKTKGTSQKPALYLATNNSSQRDSEQHITPARPNALKRVFDLSLAGSLLLISCPLLILIAIAIRLTSKGPIVLKQIRLTDGGRKFAMYKFRSMTVDAESQSGPVLAQKNDARVTPIGRILRITRMDELPQLINVLRGDMSLIGPRPERPEIANQLRKLIPHFDRRLEVKAGLTGLAQVMMGYSSCADSYKRKLALDRLYVRHQSIPLDIWIALRTVWVMMTGRGAR